MYTKCEYLEDDLKSLLPRINMQQVFKGHIYIVVINLYNVLIIKEKHKLNNI